MFRMFRMFRNGATRLAGRSAAGLPRCSRHRPRRPAPCTPAGRGSGVAPLIGLIDDSPPQPEPPGAEESAKLLEEARANLAMARELIERCGYHRRDEELAELEAVRDGRRRFADLPPRV